MIGYVLQWAAADLWGFVDCGDLGADAQGDVFVFGVAAVQVAQPLAAGLPPEVEEAVGDGVVLKHDVVHVSVPLRSEGDKIMNGNGGGGTF